MEIVAGKVHEFASLEVSGRIDSATATALQERLSETLRGSTGLIVDLARVAYLSSAGFRALLVAAKQGEDGGCRLALCGLNPEVRRLFSLGGFDELFAIHATREDCLVGLRAAATRRGVQ